MSDYVSAAVLEAAWETRKTITDSDYPREWVTSLAEDAAPWATARLKEMMVARGYSVAQVTAWDMVTHYARSLGLAYMERERLRGTVDGEAGERALLAVEERIKTAIVLIDDEVVTPGGTGGGVNRGTISGVGDTFTPESKF